MSASHDFTSIANDLVASSIERDGMLPWRKPFLGHHNPFSAGASNGYSGGNALVCAVVSTSHGYTDQRWGTYNQIQAAGGQVVAGQKGTKILKATMAKPKPHEAGVVVDHPAAQVAAGRSMEDAPAGRDRRPIMFFGTTTIFNVEQAQGINWDKVGLRETGGRAAPTDPVEAVTSAIGQRMPRVVPGNADNWDPQANIIILGEPSRYRSQDHRAWSLAANAAWASADVTRMNRPVDYAKPAALAEEAIACEAAATMVLHRLGVAQTAYPDAADSIGNWTQLLRDKEISIPRAVSRGAKIATYLLGSSSPT